MYLPLPQLQSRIFPKKPVLPSQPASNTSGIIDIADVARLFILFLSPLVFGFVFGRATDWIDTGKKPAKRMASTLLNHHSTLSMYPLPLPYRTETDL